MTAVLQSPLPPPVPFVVNIDCKDKVKNEGWDKCMCQQLCAKIKKMDKARQDGKIKAWDDIDRKGVKAAVSLGSYIEVFMKSYLKNAEVVSIAPPNTREAELVAQRVDVIMTDFPTAIKVTDEFDWATYLLPKEKLAITPYAYVVPPGDQIWLNYINLFVDTIKLDGRLMHYAKKHKLDPIVAP